MAELERRGFYMVPEKQTHRVVQLVEIGETYLSVVEPETGQRWTLNREPFERRVTQGYIQRVTPRWEPHGQAVEV